MKSHNTRLIYIKRKSVLKHHQRYSYAPSKYLIEK